MHTTPAPTSSATPTQSLTQRPPYARPGKHLVQHLNADGSVWHEHTWCADADDILSYLSGVTDRRPESIKITGSRSSGWTVQVMP